jgi:hypothetical protein
MNRRAMAASELTALPPRTPEDAEAPASAQLLIHAANDPLHAPSGRDGVLTTELRIDDLQGRPCFAADSTRSLIAVHLPAGTYHVSVRLGTVRRRYTLTLERGTTFDLYLRLPERQH